GTHIAGIVAGRDVGVARRAQIHSVKVLDKDNSGMLSWAIAGLSYVARNRINATSAARTGPSTTAGRPAIVNFSINAPTSKLLDEAIAAMEKYNVLVVASAGNGASDACQLSVGSGRHGLIVGATTKVDTLASFSNYGMCVDILAPGSNIRSASLDGGYEEQSGTSMSAPFVAGVAALFLSEKHYATVEELRDAILNRATTLGADSIAAPNTTHLLVHANP
ncbi:peptidase S8/S53 domain-containing protein, partial [Thamnocephalis sphaerospora]